MALVLTIVPGHGAASASVGRNINYIATVTNDGASSVTLKSLAVFADSGAVIVGQPSYLTPNVPVGVGDPAILAGATANYPFSIVYSSPNFAGPSPQQPGGTQGTTNASVPSDSSFNVTLQSLSSDASVASVSRMISPLSGIAPFPVAQGGALQLNSGFNLVNFLTSFA